MIEKGNKSKKKQMVVPQYNQMANKVIITPNNYTPIIPSARIEV